MISSDSAGRVLEPQLKRASRTVLPSTPLGQPRAQHPLDQPLLSIHQVASSLNVHPDTVRRLIRAGQLSSYLIAGRHRIPPASVHSYLHNRRSSRP
jgi:excisionase family DNA binding protein